MVLVEITQKRLNLPTFEKSKDVFSYIGGGFSRHVMLDYPAAILFFPCFESTCGFGRS